MNKLKLIKLAGVVALHTKSADGSIGNKAKAFSRLLIDTVTRKYTPRKRNILIGSAIIAYVLSPIDLIPGFLLDDAAIVLIAMKYFSREIDRYLAWEKQQKEKSEVVFTEAEIVNE
ncbi:MAG: hypothetical protein WCY25_07880 [Moheibacter sp.]